MRTLTYIVGLVAIAVLEPTAARAQLYVSNGGSGTVGKYDPITGAAINASFVSGLNRPAGVALDGQGHLFVLNRTAALIGRVSEYDADTGAVINADFVPNLGPQPEAIALDGKGSMFVSDFSGTVGQYNAVNGATINATLTSMTKPFGLAADGQGHLFLSDYNNGRVRSVATEPGAESDSTFITSFDNPVGVMLDGQGHLYVLSAYFEYGLGEYDATTGDLIRAKIASPSQVHGIAMDGNGDFYIASYLGGSVAKYDGATGAIINSSLVSGLSTPAYVAVAIPEPGMIGVIGILAWALPRRRR